VAQGQFREDLYHAWTLYRIVIPPLRERAEDILKLASCSGAGCVSDTAFQDGRSPPPGRSGCSPSRGRATCGSSPMSWTGHCLRGRHDPEFPAPRRGSPGADPERSAVGLSEPGLLFPAGRFSLDQTIHRLIDRALKQSEGNVSAAARLWGHARLTSVTGVRAHIR